MAKEISEEELASLSTAILARYGVDFTGYEPQSFKRRVSRALNVFQLESTHELWLKLLTDRHFIYPLIDQITVGLTAMFRDPLLWTTLKKSVLRELGERSTLRIWHAGCSTGEEVCTMGIVLGESPAFNRVQAVASDINSSAIEKAKQAVYHPMQVEEYAANYKQFNPYRKFSTYYTPQNESLAFDQQLLRHVDFRYHNLITEPMREKFDIIFCRNVMIYFDAKAKQRLLEQFHQCLNEGGFFIIGFYDALVPLIDERLFSIYNMEAKIFRKAG